MNNDLKHYKQENKSLILALLEYERLSNQKDTTIANQLVIISNSGDIKNMLNAEVLGLNNDLRKETRKKSLFKSACVGLLVALPVSFVGGFIIAQRGVVMIQ